MAIGLARMFGIILPLNFNSPYKSRSIIEFWRRWHMTLSRFLRDYLYIPLGGNRNGSVRRYVNLLLTMLLGGLWHGAGWNFIVWGGLHGCFLIINHAWLALRPAPRVSYVSDASAWVLTFLSVAVAWVFFRATSFDAAISMLGAMSGVNGISISSQFKTIPIELQNYLLFIGVRFDGSFPHGLADWSGAWVLPISFVLLSFPSSSQLMWHHDQRQDVPAYHGRLSWQPRTSHAFLFAMMSVFCLISLSSPSDFLYFQF